MYSAAGSRNMNGLHTVDEFWSYWSKNRAVLFLNRIFYKSPLEIMFQQNGTFCVIARSKWDINQMTDQNGIFPKYNLK